MPHSQLSLSTCNLKGLKCSSGKSCNPEAKNNSCIEKCRFYQRAPQQEGFAWLWYFMRQILGPISQLPRAILCKRSSPEPALYHLILLLMETDVSLNKHMHPWREAPLGPENRFTQLSSQTHFLWFKKSKPSGIILRFHPISLSFGPNTKQSSLCCGWMWEISSSPSLPPFFSLACAPGAAQYFVSTGAPEASGIARIIITAPPLKPISDARSNDASSPLHRKWVADSKRVPLYRREKINITITICQRWQLLLYLFYSTETMGLKISHLHVPETQWMVSDWLRCQRLWKHLCCGLSYKVWSWRSQSSALLQVMLLLKRIRRKVLFCIYLQMVLDMFIIWHIICGAYSAIAA